MNKKPGRKPIDTLVTDFRFQHQAMDFLMKWFYEKQVRKLFTRGKINLSIKEHKVSLHYSNFQAQEDYGMEVDLRKVTDRRHYDELCRTLSDFVLNSYFYYEREKGDTLTEKEISVLLGISPQAMNEAMRKILDKLKTQGFMIQS